MPLCIRGIVYRNNTQSASANSVLTLRNPQFIVKLQKNADRKTVIVVNDC